MPMTLRHTAWLFEDVVDAVARLADMDLNHVGASLCFPQMSHFAARSSARPRTRTSGSCA
jgi:hypothetical protein